MRSITECFTSIKDIIHDPKFPLQNRFQNPADCDLIKKTESELNLKFNDELLELYSCSNGTKLDMNYPIGMMSFMSIYMFMSLTDASKYYRTYIHGLHHIFNYSSIKQPDTKIFPVLQDGGGASYWVDLNSTNHGKILWIPIPGEEPSYHFSSLTNMINVICECYEKRIYYVEANGYLSEDLEGFFLTASKYNPDVKYWKT